MHIFCGVCQLYGSICRHIDACVSCSRGSETSVCLSICLSVYMSVCLPVCLYVCLSVYLSNTPRATFRLTWAKDHLVTTSGHQRHKGSEKRKTCFDHLSTAFITVMPKGLTAGPKSVVDGKWPNKETHPAI
jgi:hypothetical protein